MPPDQAIAKIDLPAIQRTRPAMLTILGQSDRFCDGVSRRSFLKIGALGIGVGGLTLADIFRAEA
jgi:hypothetical protein